ncbi:hypothetical protein CYG49_01155 [Candidatus Saccharibacteria bacterium]|nr:MAG: hypothetical protein CYG49_01155 [Candidatus Saccharibacteria bacterium]
MALFLKEDEHRSRIQTKVAADLKERLKDRQLSPQQEHEPAILDNQHTTRGAGILIAVLALVLLIVVLVVLKP